MHPKWQQFKPCPDWGKFVSRTSSRHLASFSFGVKAPLNYAVFVDAAAALLLAA